MQDVARSPFFSGCADEAADSSNQEQLPLVLRYVNEPGKISEDIVDFILCDQGISGQALADLIKDKLDHLGHDSKGKLRGQGYDGAGNMAGKLQGCAASITNKYPKALYMHCCAHCFNVCRCCK